DDHDRRISNQLTKPMLVVFSHMKKTNVGERTCRYEIRHPVCPLRIRFNRNDALDAAREPDCRMAAAKLEDPVVWSQGALKLVDGGVSQPWNWLTVSIYGAARQEASEDTRAPDGADAHSQLAEDKFSAARGSH